MFKLLELFSEELIDDDAVLMKTSLPPEPHAGVTVQTDAGGDPRAPAKKGKRN